MRVVGCFVEYEGKFIILHRRHDKSQGDTWGLPAGKVENGESDIKSIIREIKEETGYNAEENELEFLGEWAWHFPEKTVKFPTYRLKLKNRIEVICQPDEHLEYKWVTPEECYSMKNLVHGFHGLLEKVNYVRKTSSSN